MTDYDRSTTDHVSENSDKKEEDNPSECTSSSSPTLSVSSSPVKRRTPPPSYIQTFSSARDSLIQATSRNSQRNSPTQSKQEINDSISYPYVLRSNPPIRRISARAVGRPSPIQIRNRSRPRVAHLSSPLPPTPPIKRLPDMAETQHPTELPSQYTLELVLPDVQSRLMSSPRMRKLVTNSYTDLKSKRRVSRRKSNTALRSSASDQFKTTYSGNNLDDELPPIPPLPQSSHLNVEYLNYPEQSEAPVTPPMSTPNAIPSAVTADPPTSPLPKRAKESRYLRNAPAPLQLKSSSHRPRSKRYSRRISRESRASVQSLDTSLFPLSPFTPRPKMPSKKEQQRRRLLKLKRTLGEDVPLELITPPPSSGFSAIGMRELSSFHPGSTNINGSSSYPYPLPISVATNPVPTSPPIIPSGQKRGAFSRMRRKKNPVVPRTSAVRPAPPSALEPIRVSVDKKVSSELTPRAPSPPVILISAHPYNNIPRPETVSFDEEDDKAPIHALPALYLARRSGPDPSTKNNKSSEESGKSHWPRTPFSHGFEPISTYLALPPSFSGGAVNGTAARRSERRQGWSGEWNQPDMQDVIAKLRNM